MADAQGLGADAEHTVTTGGDSACWLSRVCECGAITEADANGMSDTCWRCGEAISS